jgi:hypothetical protein
MVGYVRSIPTGFVVASALVVGFLAGIRTASAVPLSGGFSLRIIVGGADLNGRSPRG